MKRKLWILLACSAVVPLLAQESNRHSQTFHKKEKPPREQRISSQRKKAADWEKEKMVELEQRKLKLMDRALDRIGVSEEERIAIKALQQAHRKKMKSNMLQLQMARTKLSDLQNGDATEAELDAAIEEVCDAQGAQLRILVRNRIEMERILGKDKYKEFMKNARIQYRKHGHRNGSNLPPRPDIPPMPETPPDELTPPVP